MSVRHPLNGIREGRPVWTTLFVLIALELFTMNMTAAQLQTPESPNRAVSLELALSEARAKEIIGAWERDGVKDEAYRHLRWDALFIVFYSTLAALGCVMAARAFFAPGTRAYDVALVVAWLPWLAGLLDYAENWAMYRMLGGFSGEGLPRLASSCATAKFAIIVPVALYAFAGIAASAVRALRR